MRWEILNTEKKLKKIKEEEDKELESLISHWEKKQEDWTKKTKWDVKVIL